MYPKMGMKLHKHEHRIESWTIAEGRAVITIGNETREYCAHDTVSVPVGVAHKVANNSDSNVVIIETGIGDILSESDFMRVESDIVHLDIPDIVSASSTLERTVWCGMRL